MALNVIHDLAPEIASGVVVEVSGHVLGRSLIDGLRKNFFPSSQVEQGDHYMDRSRELLQRHLELIQLDEQNTIRDYYDELVWQSIRHIGWLIGCNSARDLRERLDNPNGSIVQRFVQARKYRHKSRKTYKIVKVDCYCTETVTADSLTLNRERRIEPSMAVSWIRLRMLHMPMGLGLDLGLFVWSHFWPALVHGFKTQWRLPREIHSLIRMQYPC
jgi:hypothetical protein